MSVECVDMCVTNTKILSICSCLALLLLMARKKRRTGVGGPTAVPEEPDFDIVDRDEAAQPEVDEAERRRKASGEARAARVGENTFHARKSKLAHLTGHLPQELWDAFLERAVRPRVKAISERSVIGSLLLGFLVRGLFTLHAADLLDAQGQPLTYTDTDIPVSAADIPYLNCENLPRQLCRGLPGDGENTRPNLEPPAPAPDPPPAQPHEQEEIVEEPLSADPDLEQVPGGSEMDVVAAERKSLGMLMHDQMLASASAMEELGQPQEKYLVYDMCPWAFGSAYLPGAFGSACRLLHGDGTVPMSLSFDSFQPHKDDAKFLAEHHQWLKEELCGVKLIRHLEEAPQRAQPSPPPISPPHPTPPHPTPPHPTPPHPTPPHPTPPHPTPPHPTPPHPTPPHPTPPHPTPPHPTPPHPTPPHPTPPHPTPPHPTPPHPTPPHPTPPHPTPPHPTPPHPTPPHPTPPHPPSAHPTPPHPTPPHPTPPHPTPPHPTPPHPTPPHPTPPHPTPPHPTPPHPTPPHPTPPHPTPPHPTPPHPTPPHPTPPHPTPPHPTPPHPTPPHPTPPHPTPPHPTPPHPTPPHPTPPHPTPPHPTPPHPTPPHPTPPHPTPPHPTPPHPTPPHPKQQATPVKATTGKDGRAFVAPATPSGDEVQVTVILKLPILVLIMQLRTVPMLNLMQQRDAKRQTHEPNSCGIGRPGSSLGRPAWQQSEPTNLLTRPPRPPTPYALTPTSKCQARHIFIDTRGLYGLMRDAGMLGVLTEQGVTSLPKFRNGALPDSAKPGHYIEGPNKRPELPLMSKGMGAVNPLAHLHAEWLGVDPGKTVATVAHEERDADGNVVSVWQRTLTAVQYYRDSGITRQAQATKTWLANVKPQLTALSRVSSKPSSLASYRRFADTVLATYNAMWAEVSKPR
ncbi:hypothetical protein QJQ45_004342 [Haematococcus lacustris]|nr:hypothetical protein QJQ45_004342 [Haematococcus lacustris]